MGPGEAIAAVAFAGVLIGVIVAGAGMFKRFMAYKEAKLAAQGTTAENRALIARIEVLERIVTDRGHDLASEIEALRSADTRDTGVPLAIHKERV